jgi:hypothetical protein
MKECHHCIFKNMDCAGPEAYFILEVLIRVRPEIDCYCALFDSARIETYRQLQEHLRLQLELPADLDEAGETEISDEALGRR